MYSYNILIYRCQALSTVRRHRKQTSTETQGFGVSKRESHDSSRFYSRKLYRQSTTSNRESNGDGKYGENHIKHQNLNRLFCKSSEKMDELPDYSVHLMVTSPPYNVGKDYDQDLSVKEYRSLLKQVFKETFRVLVYGGRACINVANLGRKPYIPLHSYIIEDMHELGFLMRGEIIWNKAASSGVSTAWGSWQSASNPILRDVHEYVLVFSKGSFSRNSQNKENTITKGEFLTFTKSTWDFPAESATRVGHPAPFPIDLPYRCIQLYTFKGEVVLDPFCGIGTTCIAAIKSGRRFVGYDVNKEYVEVANSRINQYH
ncbi:MAG TPA: site-specific DNA-methyltransferase [Nitrososphaera sp.]|nr:site-specific DNA-methyltransferase [Nitrososphaera sp.]